MSKKKKAEPQPEQPLLYIHHLLDPAVCVDGGKHQWDGEPLEFGWGSSATCSKCGRDAMSVDAFVAP